MFCMRFLLHSIWPIISKTARVMNKTPTFSLTSVDNDTSVQFRKERTFIRGTLQN